MGFGVAQNHDHFWLFGYDAWATDPLYGGSVIDFNAEPPLVYQQDKDMNIDVTMASTCDSAGVLKFYTNGISINDTTHQTMVNGDSLNPGEIADDFASIGYPLTSSEIVLQVPGSQHRYYLFHLKIDYHPIHVAARTTFYLTVIDMGLNNGLGEVVSKNQELLTDGWFGTVNAIKHANGRDWWVWIADYADNDYHYFLLTPEGLQGPYDYSAMPNFFYSNSEGQIIFSPDGNKAARYNVKHGVYFYDFDRCASTFSNPVFVPLPNSDLGGGIAFSPNSRFFYLAYDADRIYQYDLWAGDIAGSKTTIATWDGYFSVSGLRTSFFMMQLGPDGRIYVNSPNSVAELHVIDRPNEKGTACRMLQHSLHLPTINGFTSPYYPHYRLGPLDGSPCDTLGLDNHPIAKYRYDQDTADYLSVRFTDLSYYEPAEWAWSFGDGTVSQDTSPVHTFPGDGTYEVCLTVTNQYSSNTYCQTLVIGTGVSGTGGAVGQQPEVSVFPNPAKEATNFILSGYLPRHAELRLFTATGQLALAQRIGFGWSLVGLEGIAPGLYFYEVRDNGKLLGSGKLVRVE